MEKLILAAHLLTAMGIIGLILLQQGKGADIGASFGSGASQTLFGSAGSWNFFSKITAVLVTVFFVTSFGLAIIAKNSLGVPKDVLPEMRILESKGVPDGKSGDVPAVDAESDVPEAAAPSAGDQPEGGASDVPK